jgi:hypothetical protein|tara:strand:- start:38 stop:352 length:315 start_codon:yes stop_codon:yes gene_type:complete
MNFNELEFKETETPKGIQALVQFGRYELSVINNEMSYGNKEGLYEIAVSQYYKMTKSRLQCELPGITRKGDTVQGFLSEDGVDVILKKMMAISGSDGLQFYDYD